MSDDGSRDHLQREQQRVRAEGSQAPLHGLTSQRTKSGERPRPSLTATA